MPVVTVTASMPAELAQALHANARKADRSFSAEMRVAIRAHLRLNDSINNSDGAPASTSAPSKRERPAPHDEG